MEEQRLVDQSQSVTTSTHERLTTLSSSPAVVSHSTPKKHHHHQIKLSSEEVVVKPVSLGAHSPSAVVVSSISELTNNKVGVAYKRETFEGALIKSEKSVLVGSTTSSSSSASATTAALIVKELEKFDPTTPEEEFSPRNQNQTAKLQAEQSQSIKENNSLLSQIAEYMEVHTVHPVIKSFLVGSISGTCSTVLFQPLDLLKTRLQTPTIRHGAPTSAALRATSVAAAAAASGPNGLLTVLGHIVRDEKLRGLWKGMTPSLTRCVPGVGLYFASIHGLKIAFDINGEPTPLQSVLLGVTGRSISGVMMIPFTVIKTRFESTVYNYSSIREALFSIYRKEGVRGLTCGLMPTLLRDAPFSGLYLLMYTSTKKGVPQEWIESTTFGPYVRFSCGVVAGIGASLITQPADVLKTKMQLYPDKFHSIPEVVTYVYKKYGAQGYFKGLLPRMVRRTLIAAMSWTVYEQVMKSIGLK